MLGILSLGAARFFNMVRTDHEAIFEAKYFFFSFVLLCWFFSDSLANLREEIFSLFSGGFSIGITMSYDYSKYFFSGYLFYLSSHKWIKSKKEISETIDFVNAPQINNRLPETVFITGPNKIFIFILFLTFCMGLSFFRTHLNVSSNRFLRPENEKTSFQPGFHGNLNGTIIGSIVNVRKAPELQGEIIFQLKEGESISFDEVRDDGWYVIPGTLGEVGYIWGSYIRPNVYQKFTNAEVTEKNGTHIKSGPGRSYETLKELKYKEKILIRNKNLNDEWLEVLLPNGKQGYVLSKRLEIK